ncbi:Permease of the drug/metabolite transporter (DMT) superfamily [Marinobacterium lacunae]|uniref:Permease of the drug/metabolite transporter (DMT) superfamily n=1 Tax=Marinobacterium lacunae TaxID=1232683 RepID=A0A081FUI2_9GAMM|nr:DMT family transporter [Marinobacterium lacunae]KEA62187.1 Permease of the drug/metabolite transporter (DMT) superfamily [Marinobacterium lacunae]
MPLSNHVKADLLLVLTTLLAAAGWIFSKEALAGLAPLLFIAMRFSSAGLLVASFRLGSLKALSAEQWRASLKVGMLFGVAMVFWILGLHLSTHLGVGAFLTSLGVVMVPLMGLFFGERPGRYVFYSLPFVASGLACLSLDTEFSIGLGEMSFLTAALFFSLTFILNSRASARIPTVPLTAIQLVLAGIITFVVSIFTETWNFDQPMAIWGWFLASTLIATSLRFSIQTRAQGLAPASHAAIIMTLEPVWAALMAAWWLGEQMSPMQIAGCSMIFLAMLVNRWPAVRYWVRNVGRGGIR